MIPEIGLVALAGEYEVGFSDTPALLQRAAASLRGCGFKVAAAPEVMHDSESVKKDAEALSRESFDVLCVCVGTWSEDHHLLDLMEYFDKPVILWAFPAVETGSLCGVQQICCVLKELDKTYFYVYGEPDSTQVLREIGEISRAVALKNRLRHVKIGTIGGRVKGMTEVAFDELEIKERTGVRIVNLDEEELTAAYDHAIESKAAERWEQLRREAGKVTSTQAHGVEALRYYLAMKALIAEYGLEGIVVKCYPRYMGKICLGYSLLSEEGYVCGCEGDVNSTVLMKILRELTGKPIHNTDLLYPDEELNTILFSHCGSGGFSIAADAQSIHLAPVRLAESGVCARFPAKTGAVTLANLVGRRGTMRMSVGSGESVACGMEFPGNPLKIQFAAKVGELNRRIAYEGIGHHWMCGYGDVTRELEHFCRLCGIKLIQL
ncbi:MAG: hypothetical protein P4L75_02495 [Clostridia bacterium]|nr:hypothetical protein [Clostridia bacterium]